MMMTGLMSGRTSADEYFAGCASEMPGSGVPSKEQSAKQTDCERLAAMPMPELLYYALVGEREIANESS